MLSSKPGVYIYRQTGLTLLHTKCAVLLDYTPRIAMIWIYKIKVRGSVRHSEKKHLQDIIR